MSGGRAIVFDVNFLSLMHCIDEACDLIDYICACFGGYPVGDEHQLRKMDYCEHVPNEIGHQNVTDDDIAMMIGEWESLSFARVARDPADLRLLAYALRESGILMTCDAGILRLAHEMDVEHWCFKASLWEADEALDGGIVGDPHYKTELMEEAGANPFFYRCCCTRCAKCDPPRECRHGHVGAMT